MHTVREHELPGNALEPDLALVEDETEALDVASGTLGDVGDDVVVFPAEDPHHAFQRAEVVANLLDRHNIEPRDDLGNVIQIFLRPGAAHEAVVVEVSDIPCAQNEGGVARFLGHLVVKLRAEPVEAAQSPLPICFRHLLDWVVVRHRDLLFLSFRRESDRYHVD